MSKLGEGILTSTGRETNFFGGHAIPKPNFWFWHHIAAEFRHTLKNFEVGLSKQNFKKKLFCSKRVSKYGDLTVYNRKLTCQILSRL
jgi:hypothetical protein